MSELATVAPIAGTNHKPDKLSGNDTANLLACLKVKSRLGRIGPGQVRKVWENPKGGYEGKLIHYPMDFEIMGVPVVCRNRKVVSIICDGGHEFPVSGDTGEVIVNPGIWDRQVSEPGGRLLFTTGENPIGLFPSAYGPELGFGHGESSPVTVTNVQQSLAKDSSKVIYYDKANGFPFSFFMEDPNGVPMANMTDSVVSNMTEISLPILMEYGESIGWELNDWAEERVVKAAYDLFRKAGLYSDSNRKLGPIYFGFKSPGSGTPSLVEPTETPMVITLQQWRMPNAYDLDGNQERLARSMLMGSFLDTAKNYLTDKKGNIMTL